MGPDKGYKIALIGRDATRSCLDFDGRKRGAPSRKTDEVRSARILNPIINVGAPVVSYRIAPHDDAWYLSQGESDFL